jgi:CHASE3 domain sensor protein
MKIKHKLAGVALILVFIVSLAGVYSLVATDEIIRVFRKGEVHFKDIIKSSTNISSCAKRMESYLMLYLTFGDKQYLDRFYSLHKNIAAEAENLQVLVKKQNSKVIVDEIISSLAELIPSVKTLISRNSPEAVSRGKLLNENFKNNIIEFHNTTSRIRKLGVKLAHLETDFLNRQEAISCASEIGSYVKRSEGHLMKYLFLGEEEDRIKFFDRYYSMTEEIKKLKSRMTSSSEKKHFRELKMSIGLFIHTGNRILKEYRRRTGGKAGFAAAGQKAGADQAGKSRNQSRQKSGNTPDDGH